MNKFLINTGAEVSVLPATASQKTLSPVTHLYVANGIKVPVYKGRFFLTHFDLLVNIKNCRLQDPLTSVATSAATTTGESTRISTVSADNPYVSLLKSFPTLTQPYSATGLAKHHVTYHIKGTRPPTCPNARRLAPECYQAAKSEFESLLRQDITRPSSSNWSFALHIVSKENGDIRPYRDYRHGQVSDAQYSRVLLATLWLYYLLQNRPRQGVSPDSS